MLQSLNASPDLDYASSLFNNVYEPNAFLNKSLPHNNASRRRPRT